MQNRRQVSVVLRRMNAWISNGHGMFSAHRGLSKLDCLSTKFAFHFAYNLKASPKTGFTGWREHSVAEGRGYFSRDELMGIRLANSPCHSLANKPSNDSGP